jgi:hypothetical protein
VLRFQFCVFFKHCEIKEIRRKWSDPKSQIQYNLASLITGDSLLFTMKSAQKTCCCFITKTSKLMQCRDRTAAACEKHTQVQFLFSMLKPVAHVGLLLRRVTRPCVMHRLAAERWEQFACYINIHSRRLRMLILLCVCNEKFLKMVLSPVVSVWRPVTTRDSWSIMTFGTGKF